MHLSESHYLIVFNEAFIPYNELQFLDWPSIVVHSPTGLMYIAYGLVILVHRNIQVTTLKIGYIQFCQGFECWDVEEELTKGIMQSLKWEYLSNFSTKLIHVCKKLPVAVLEIKILLVPVNWLSRHQFRWSSYLPQQSKDCLLPLTKMNELWNVEFWGLKKLPWKLYKSDHIQSLNISIKHVQEKEKDKQIWL